MTEWDLGRFDEDEYNLLLNLTQFGKEEAVTDREAIRIRELRKKLFNQAEKVEAE